MEKKQTPNSRQSNLSINKDLTPNSKLTINEWKREYNNGRYSNKDGFKKYNQPKPPPVYENKQPRQRGYVGKCPKEEMRKTGSQNSDFEEQASASLEEKKYEKTASLNHMVKFYNAERTHARLNGYGRNNRRHNKEIFLQANCQFVVKADGKYNAHAIDPDLLIDWQTIMQVKLFVNEFPSCPICLFPPRAAKITKCGHVYCWPCMLHYLSLTDEKQKWAKCPVCCESVYETDLRSASVREVTKYEPGLHMTMRLMKKARGAMTLAPRLSWRGDLELVRGIRDIENSSYSKFLEGDFDYLNMMFEEERLDLTQLLKDESDSLERTYILSALQLLENEQCNLNQNLGLMKKLEIASIKKNGSSNIQDPSVSGKGVSSVRYSNMKTYACAFDDEEEYGVACDQECTVPSPHLVSDSELCMSPVLDDSFQRSSFQSSVASGLDALSKDNSDDMKVQYFYQAADGQHIYMHSVNIRCLKAEYSSLERCPDEIVAEVVDSEDYSMTEELRRRFTFLSHLPVFCQFKIVELKLLPPLVSPESLMVVEEQVNKRSRERKVKEKRDKNNAIKIQRIESKMMGYDPESTYIQSDYTKYQEEPNFSGIHNFPEMQKTCENNPPLTYALKKKEGGDGQGMSFAQMLKAGKSQPFKAPRLANSISKNPDREVAADDSDYENREVPDFSASWNFDIAKKLGASTFPLVANEEKNSQKKKKKGKKGTLLFGTSTVGPCCK